MKTPSGYRALRRLSQRPGCTVSQGIRLQDERRVIIKQVDDSHGNREETSRLRHEYELLVPLRIAGVSRPIELIETEGGLAVIFEDTGALPLRQFMANHQRDWHQWLTFAIRVAELLGQLREARIIHKQINPDHLLIHPTSDEPLLIGFSMATLLSHEQPNWHTPMLNVRGQSYIAPEQTGRINRTIDYRTDYYGLGATLYELMSGRPPFKGESGMELVHNQIARPPRPPHKINPRLPEVVSGILLKLLAKDAAQRYQSTVGLVYDLRRCQREFENRQTIPLFELAQMDRSARFQIPQKLYGRESVLNHLREHFDQKQGAHQSLVTISGYAGVGKSSLVNELRPYVIERGGHFISGKFDQFRRSRPYFAIFQALQGLVRQLLTEPEQDVRYWRDVLLSTIRGQGATLLKMIPELELIIGPQPKPPYTAPSNLEDQGRFSRMLLRLLQVLGTKERPLALFLDDLHWADLASLQLLETLARETDPLKLMLVGSYRDHELGPTHPLKTTLGRLRLQEPVIEIHLEPLNQQQVRQLVADTLRCEPQECDALAHICIQKTQGNPFFLSQFLYALYEQELIAFRDQRWQWDEAAIEAREMTDNVITLMVSKIQRLPRTTQTVLPLAAAIGSSFNLRTLSVVSNLDPVQVSDNLWPAITEGLIVPLSDQYQLVEQIDPKRARFRFIHDRVQQAAYSLIPDDQREALHLQIGRQLQQSLTPDEIDNRIFEITNHLNIARGAMHETFERTGLAEINLRSGARARESAAFDAAMEYLNTGIDLLPNDSWKKHYTLSLNLYSKAAEVASIKGDQALVNRLATEVEEHARTLLDKVRIYELRIQSQVASNRFSDALDTALQLLQSLGVTIPRRTTPAMLAYSRARIRWLLRRHPPDSVPQLKAMRSPELLAAMPILASIFGVIKFSSSDLRPLVMAKQVELTLIHGINPYSALAFAGYGGVLCGQFNAIDLGYRLGQLALELDTKLPPNTTQHRTLSLFSCYIRHYREPLSVCTESLLEAHQQALDCGDLEWSAYSLAAHIQYVLPLSTNLDELLPRLEQYATMLRESGQQQSLQYSVFTLQCIENLRGRNTEPTHLDGRFYKETEGLEELERENHRTAISLHHYYKGLLCFLMGETELAHKHSEQADSLRDSISGTFTAPCARFLNGLSIIALLPKTSILQQPPRLKKVRSILHYLRRLAHYCPENHQHRHDLLKAELLRAQHKYSAAMELYEQAVELAGKQGFLFEQALASELAGRFYLEWKKPGIATTYLKDAYQLYARWGAKVKLAQMEQTYALRFEPKPAPTPEPSEQRQTQPDKVDNHSLDIASVISASQAISDEIVLERLLERLMKLAIQNAGAQRALLLMARQQQLYIEAETSIDRAPSLTKPVPLESGSDQLPVSIIHYVTRTKDAVVLGNAVEHQMFQQDSYIRSQQPCSLLAIPILYHSELTGILYLEHRESRDIFSRERLNTLQILASQAAISIENAKLYKSLEQSEREYRSLFENASEGIFRIDQDGRFVSANPALVNLLGYSSADQLLDTAPDLVHDCFINPSDGQRFLEQLNSGNPVQNFETHWQSFDGHEVYVSISANRILDKHASSPSYEGSLTDISERKAKEQAVLARQKAEAANEAKTQFLATMSHEIRTPMNGILGMAQLLKRTELSAKQSMQVSSILSSGQSLLSILNDVLDFTKIETGQVSFEEADFDLRQLLEQVHLLMTPSATQKGIDLISRIADDLPARARGDSRALNQILMNLVTNAIKFTSEGYVIIKAYSLSTSDEGYRIRFEVEDSGIGIPPEAHEHIFQHFSQADSSITRRFGGTGLGLSICKKLAEQQEGRIGFQSTPGKGSLFWIELPYRRAVIAETGRTLTPPARPLDKARPLDILLVEDSPINQEVTAELLRSAGHTLSIADDGFTALSMHNDHDYDLVLMDIHLPEMDGTEVTKRMRLHSDPRKAQVPVVALTAAVTSEDMQRYEQAGITTVIAKPLNFQELEQTLFALSSEDSEPQRDLNLEETCSDSFINHALLNQHRSLLGPEQMHSLLEKMKAQSSALLDQLEQEEPTNHRYLMHKLAGVSANFGLAKMARECINYEALDQISADELKALRSLWEMSISALESEDSSLH
ncbi:AAA family ATPase [Marinobacterium sp. YM272]|uniref:AAA family ATPase n=1 Tax=Marinobacterium sp. YM272 TaxID=3421654 RepID=UPI003D7F95EB